MGVRVGDASHRRVNRFMRTAFRKYEYDRRHQCATPYATISNEPADAFAIPEATALEFASTTELAARPPSPPSPLPPSWAGEG